MVLSRGTYLDDAIIVTCYVLCPGVLQEQGAKHSPEQNLHCA